MLSTAEDPHTEIEEQPQIETKPQSSSSSISVQLKISHILNALNVLGLIVLAGTFVYYLYTNKVIVKDLETQNLKTTIALKNINKEILNLRNTVYTTHHEAVIFLKIIYLKPDIDRELAQDIAKLIYRYCKAYEIDSDLILSMIIIESEFNPEIKSPVGALGLMQIMPHWIKIWDIKGPLSDPEISIKYGIQIFKSYQDLYKDLEMALSVYNRGPSPVDWDLIKNKDPVTSNNYPKFIMEKYKKLRELNVK